MRIDPVRLLTKGALDDVQIESLLGPVGFADSGVAHSRLLGICRDDAHREAFAASLPMLLSALENAATPDSSVMNFERLVQAVPDSLDLLQFLAGNPRAVEILVRLFVGSQFLTEILLRNPEYLARLTRHTRLAEFRAREEFRAEAEQTLQREETVAAKFDVLRRFQHWELLRIGACDLFGLMDLKSITVQLSLLADAIVQTALAIITGDKGPAEASPASETLTDFCIIAYGKLGGEELNYSSDIDLVFISRKNAERYWDTGQRLIRGLMDATGEGFLYRVDMRLRPWGRSGPLVTTAEAFLEYLKDQSELWERQALLKARPIAGDLALGREFLSQVEPIVFAVSTEDARANVRDMKEKIEAGLRKKGLTFGEVKSGQGSIRDIEFVTQFLQLQHGEDDHSVRSINTLDGLVRLTERDHIQANEFRQLTTAYIFLRKVEHSLQLTHGKQLHSLPTEDRELAWFSGRLDYPDTSSFLESFRRHTADVRTIYERYIETDEEPKRQPPTPPTVAHVQVMEASYAKVFSAEDIQRHGVLLSQLGVDCQVAIEAVSRGQDRVELTVCGFDQRGDLALMCGLLFAFGFDIVNGNVFTAEHVLNAQSAAGNQSDPAATDESQRHRFVNVFLLKPPTGVDLDAVWDEYQSELTELVALAERGELREAQGQLVRKVARSVRSVPRHGSTLLPIEIAIDNAASDRYTVLNIGAEDTPGFVYELASALTLAGYNIQRVILSTIGNRAVDRLDITSTAGTKLTDEAELSRLRAAVVLIKHFTHLLPQSPNPEKALLHFRQLLEQLLEQDNWFDELTSLDRGEVLEALARLLGVSDFLWDDFLRLQHNNLFPVVRDIEALTERHTRDQLESELADQLNVIHDSEAGIDVASLRREHRRILSQFKDRAMFRVDMRHIVGHISEFGQFSDELTDVAEVVTAAAFQLCFDELVAKRGQPKCIDGSPCHVSVCALGKAGGRELGFASDIELLFVYSGQGHTDGPDPASNSDFHVRLVEKFTKLIPARRKGIFEIDLQLRPYGSAGPLAISVEVFEEYFSPGGAAWPYERQALVRLRPVAGNKELGRQLIEIRDRLVYTEEPFDVSAMRAMRERQLRQLVTPGVYNAKLSSGGLVDCEYTVQALQISHGHKHPALRSPNTLEAIEQLRIAGILTEQDFHWLGESYIFLRRLIDALRMVRGDARDLTVPPAQSDEFEYLARRLGYGTSIDQLQRDMEQTAERVSQLARLLES
ncbi:MAG: glutamine synthetase adenylyltransferase [Planctomycetota bacterium]|nr:glutamine synthetase adenylyltransferase [Planctomycetota bacterium]MDA1251128.1 glutamine synthetase adenylyltransferase [Planctomycetota bacterium]